MLQNTMNAVSESEITVTYANAKDATKSRVILIEIGHLQSLTPLEINANTVFSILTNQLLLQ